MAHKFRSEDELVERYGLRHDDPQAQRTGWLGFPPAAQPTCLSRSVLESQRLLKYVGTFDFNQKDWIFHVPHCPSLSGTEPGPEPTNKNKRKLPFDENSDSQQPRSKHHRSENDSRISAGLVNLARPIKKPLEGNEHLYIRLIKELMSTLLKPMLDDAVRATSV